MAQVMTPPPEQPYSSPLAAAHPSPSLSASSSGRGKRARAGSDEEAIFLFHEKEAANIRAAYEETIGPDMKRRVKRSLEETLVDVQNAYPDEVGAKDMNAARRRASSDLSELACHLSTPGGASLPAASPLLAATVPPLELPPLQEAVDVSTSGFLEHDGFFDHEQLMQAIYLSQGLDFDAVQGQAQKFLRDMGMKPHDLGVKNEDENGRVLVNQCFYLSIARSYLGDESVEDQVSGLALRLKRAIETAVLAARPNWAQGDGEAMAFADFLPIAMRADDAKDDSEPTSAQAEQDLLAELAVCVLDSVQGHVEVFLGPKYDKLEDKETKERNLILLWFTPGHYQCIVVDDDRGSKVKMTYEDFKGVLTEHGVMYIETME
eukprot:TRINITY_DN26446_c0_g1_i1.p1 TRINITY_DN26446_c0_g1~~TRINITY_DN26446_c0_g1_i1.p1  ORF type:complete len:411 (+),score=106.86 TRINITY_DN26446_c0_g1_i1:103-1233(+)